MVGCPAMDTSEQATKSTGPSLPVLVLTTIGAVIAVLGFFVGGNPIWVAIGLGSVLAAGLVGVLERFVETMRSR